MAIEARCPHCESTIRAADKYAGQQVKCPKCGGVMQVPASSSADAAPAAASASPPASADAPVVAAPPAIGSDAPIVQVGDDELWRKSVSRKKPAARKSGGSPGWLWPVIALAVCGLVAAGLFVWMKKPGGVAAESHPQSVEVAQSSPGEDDASAQVAEPNTSEEASQAKPSENESGSSDARSSSPNNDADSQNPRIAAASPDGNDPAIASPASSENAADMPEKAMPDKASQPETVTKEDAAADIAESASASPSAPIELKGPPEEVLKEHGIRIVGEQATLIDEARPQISAALSEAKKLRLSLTRSYADALKLERLQKELKADYGNLSAALAQVNANGGSVQQNNLLVGQLSAIRTKLEQIEEQVESSRAKLAESRESYIEHLLGTREIVNGVEQKDAVAAADPQVKAALAKLSKDGNEFALEPLGSFYRAQKELATLESQVLSDTIAARVESGNLFVSTQINGEHTIEMVVDSGASVVTLPYEMAVKAGLKPKDTDPDMQLQIADGSIISGKQITIPSLRVGKFTVENVEAAVLGPEAVSATPLLGMSFLSKFETKIDSERGQLILSRIEGTEGSDRIR
jgi:aspartyl protease family protein